MRLLGTQEWWINAVEENIIVNAKVFKRELVGADWWNWLHPSRMGAEWEICSCWALLL